MIFSKSLLRADLPHTIHVGQCRSSEFQNEIPEIANSLQENNLFQNITGALLVSMLCPLYCRVNEKNIVAMIRRVRSPWISVFPRSQVQNCFCVPWRNGQIGRVCVKRFAFRRRFPKTSKDYFIKEQLRWAQENLSYK